MTDDEGAQPAEPAKRIRANDSTFVTIPIIDHSITLNEIHASTIGAA